ncbi:glycosyltransferase family 2 protein [Suhomyces tanzawaensis NRRL Y-17324]|uniref:Chitin synthase n=1 Tax=Suhomyces tanzawaensis NRRL Y-17324 TaxID=984487 RepID=A0A1E4SNN6_9ASCO|nr:glycosyltransferase family 2 protein [Suhomyces tanzawaensis NRRL Y-17324]ODV81131.1 glycosyltransferase family 2 protein [Suhomyces tanzawaensis NRRL Y-17324]
MSYRPYHPSHSDESINEYLNPHQPGQHAGAYNYHHNNSSSSINFQHPEPAYAHHTGPDRSEYDAALGYYNHQSLERPSNIFNTLHIQPPNLSPINTHNDPFGDTHTERYEMGEMPSNFHHHTFVPHVYDDEDDEREFDQKIQYNQFEGDHYDLQTVHVPETPPTPPAAPEFETPFGDDGEFAEPPPEEPVREKPQIGIASGLNGHLVLDCPVATELLTKFPDYNPNQKDGGLSREFAYMRYTAVTCGPSNFYRDGYILRPIHYPMPRQTELMIVITMYNEDDILLARTLKGVFKNIKHLESRTKLSTWGKDSWKKVVVCIVSDGRSKINERAQALLAGLGVYQEGLAKSRVDDKKVQAHIYEYTARVGISSVEDTVKLTTEKIVPVQLLFCLKENNAKKINSHRWCFQALGQVLDPKIVILLDAGTQPSGKALYHLWKEFDRDAQVAGACGEIKASLSKRQILTNPIVYGQNFEYKISNILDKPTESVFGFISVLPGAFSAYRYVALQNDVNGKGPLEKYFKGEFLHGSGELDPNDDEYELKKFEMREEAGIFTSNMYLAEDRILCYELVAKRGCAWLLRYCKAALAETDVPESLSEFILQRRRWLNGSFFAAIYSLVKFPKLWHSSHSFGRKLFLHIEFFYQFLNLVVSWFSISSYFLVFRILTTSLADPDLGFAPGNVLSAIFLWLYLASIVTTFVLSFGNKPKGTERFYIVIVVFFAILMAYMVFAAIFMAVHSIQEIYKNHTKITVGLFFANAEFRDLVVATSSTYALYFLASFLYFEPWHMFTSFVQYILLSPSYINVLNIYAFCNIDDVSWGTKGDTGAKDLGAAKVREDGTFDVKIPISQEEINQSYLDQLEKIKNPVPEDTSPHVQSNEDYYAFVRSMTVLVWITSNFIVIALVLLTGGLDQFVKQADESRVQQQRSIVFLTVILWMVAFMALFRFVGCILYLIQRFGRSFRGSDHSTAPLKR